MGRGGLRGGRPQALLQCDVGSAGGAGRGGEVVVKERSCQREIFRKGMEGGSNKLGGRWQSRQRLSTCGNVAQALVFVSSHTQYHICIQAAACGIATPRAF